MNAQNIITTLLNNIQQRETNQPEFLQAIHEIFHSLTPFLEQYPQYMEQGLLERLIEPERIIQFRVCWVNDQGKTEVNRAWRVQFNSALGPYKGGIRFHPSVNLSVMKFLAFEQTFKNALTTLQMGGAKGGSDFNPKGKSPQEVMRFCHAFMLELHRHIGSDTDIPAGDIGVGAREIGWLNGYMKKLTNQTSCTFTGKGLAFGGSILRPQATGYGLIYFTQAMLAKENRELAGCKIAISGSGNVAQYAIEKAIAYGAKVVTVSDSDGTVIDPSGFTLEKLNHLMQIKNIQYGRVSDYAAQCNLTYLSGQKPWGVPVDIALPCATQNEITLNDALLLIKNGVIAIAEGANMPTTLDATNAFHQNKILFAPGKAANAGGVATSGLEMSQNAMRLHWSEQEVDSKLQQIMHNIHENCVRYGSGKKQINYIQGANIASFKKIADAMLAQGVV